MGWGGVESKHRTLPSGMIGRGIEGRGSTPIHCLLLQKSLEASQLKNYLMNLAGLVKRKKCTLNNKS